MEIIDFKLRRTLTLAIEGATKPIVVEVGGIGQVSPDAPWECSCFVEELMTKPTKVFGEDALDALLNCLSYCAGLIEDANNRGRAIWWIERGDFGSLRKKQ